MSISLKRNLNIIILKEEKEALFEGAQKNPNPE